MPDYRALVEFIAKALVTCPDDVKVTLEDDEKGNIKVLIGVRKEDIGRIIGKRGSTINAIRQVVKAAAVKPGKRVDIDVLEDVED